MKKSVDILREMLKSFDEAISVSSGISKSEREKIQRIFSGNAEMARFFLENHDKTPDQHVTRAEYDLLAKDNGRLKTEASELRSKIRRLQGELETRLTSSHKPISIYDEETHRIEK